MMKFVSYLRSRKARLGCLMGVHLEDHPSGCKWLGSLPFISHEVRLFGRGTTLLRGFTNHGFLTTYKSWDDPPSSPDDPKTIHDES